MRSAFIATLLLSSAAAAPALAQTNAESAAWLGAPSEGSTQRRADAETDAARVGRLAAEATLGMLGAGAGVATGFGVVMLAGECTGYDCLALGVAGIAVGIVGSLFATAALVSVAGSSVDGRFWRAFLGAVIGLGAGAAVAALGFMAEEPLVMLGGVVVAGVGQVIGAMIAYEASIEPSAPLSLSLAPVDGGGAATLSGSF